MSHIAKCYLTSYQDDIASYAKQELPYVVLIVLTVSHLSLHSFNKFFAIPDIVYLQFIRYNNTMTSIVNRALLLVDQDVVSSRYHRDFVDISERNYYVLEARVVMDVCVSDIQRPFPHAGIVST